MKMQCSLANISAICISVQRALLYSIFYCTACSIVVQCALLYSVHCVALPINWGRTHIAAPWPHKREGSPFSHLKTHSGEKSNKCNQCDYASSRADSLRAHLKMHSGDKSNKCNQCDFASSYTSALRTHLKTHSNLRRLKIHSGEKSNKCNHCDYASPQASNLRTHMEKHTWNLFDWYVWFVQ